jgi:hypothetical protein
MRSFFGGTFMSLGGVCVAFGTVVFILTLAVKRYNPGQGLEGRVEVGLAALVLGAILLGAGVFLSRLGSRSRSQ